MRLKVAQAIKTVADLQRNVPKVKKTVKVKSPPRKEVPDNKPASTPNGPRSKDTKDKPPHFGLKKKPEPSEVLGAGSKVENWLRPTNVPIERVEPPYEAEIPKLAHGLDRVLFNPGVYWLQDPHSRVYNFEPYLQKILPPDDFAYDRLMSFELWDLAEKHNRKYIGSTSGLTSIMSHIYWLISRWRPIDTRSLSADFAREPNSFGFGSRVPVSSRLVYKDGRYAMDPDKEWEVVGKANSILMYLGTLMEKMLTMEPDTFSRLRKAVPETNPREFHKRESYYYSKTSKFLMRSQLDCHDARLPGTGTFDLKTRGVIPIRRDRLNYVENSGYLIKYSQGLFESFEREYYDMMRSAFLKYNFQVRIGNMDGIFVAYHNTAQIFGFQYIPRDEMDIRLFGSTDMADDAFHLIVGVLEAVLDTATDIFPNQTLRMTYETPEGKHSMSVWVQPDEWDDKAGPRPIVRLEIQTQSFLDGHLVAHPIDYDSVRRGADPVDWSLKYRITQSPSTPRGRAEAVSTLEKARMRQREVQKMILPSGVGAEEMLAKFDTMDVADIIRARQTPAEVESEHEGFIEDVEEHGEEDISLLVVDRKDEEAQEDDVDSTTASRLARGRHMRFVRPGGSIMELRKLARAGAEASRKLEEMEAKIEKVVWRPSSAMANPETSTSLATEILTSTAGHTRVSQSSVAETGDPEGAASHVKPDAARSNTGEQTTSEEPADIDKKVGPWWKLW
ncbi:Pet127-domain-containing protein [Calocera cornea HHB12733]|uniref:Pet127-domain-containing protein n=1 Tax=Calocera cornea HHB12733 TaxID=1353952 RepID=A0A165I491_9BASI|nr:Pet127-domain-containing protein [Calocera cornea HHB12733]